MKTEIHNREQLEAENHRLKEEIDDLIRKLQAFELRDDNRALSNQKATLENSVQFKAILDACAEAWNVTVKEILSPKRTHEISCARHMAMHFVRKRMQLPYGRIGQMFNRDHGAVIYAVNAISSRREWPSVFECLRRVENRLNAK